MKNYGVRMIREHMNDIPDVPIPTGYRVRNYRAGEGHIWTRIQRAAEKFFDIDEGLFDRLGRSFRFLHLFSQVHELRGRFSRLSVLWGR